MKILTSSKNNLNILDLSLKVEREKLITKTGNQNGYIQNMVVKIETVTIKRFTVSVLGYKIT